MSQVFLSSGRVNVGIGRMREAAWNQMKFSVLVGSFMSTVTLSLVDFFASLSALSFLGLQLGTWIERGARTKKCKTAGPTCSIRQL